MSMFKGWSFSRKLLAVNISYLLPCSVLVYFLVLEKNNNIEFNQKERTGIEYQRPLASLLSHVGQHKLLMIAAINHASDFANKIDLSKAQIERDFSVLDDVSAHLGDELQFTAMGLASRKREKAATQSLRANWQAIVEGQDKPTADSITAVFDPLISGIRLAINQLGDTSNLILDPDLDSYYMMDTTLISIPKVQDRIQELGSYVKQVSGSSESLTEEQKQKIDLLAALMRADLAQISGSVQVALNEDKNFGGILMSMQKDIPTALKDFTGATEALLAASAAVVKTPLDPNQSEKLLVAADKALEQTLIFWTKAADELDKIIAQRVADIKSARLVALALALLAWLPSGLFAAITVIRLNRSFIKAVSKLKSEASNANSASTHLSAASQTVSSGSTEQAAAIQETGASMSEMASMVARSSTQASSSQELARKVKEQTDEGCRVMERMVSSMESIGEANSHLQNISNIINDISAKTNIINDIVGKTQLLSFNASIEAARAGQHGKGFAVVAEEVGNLAQTSGNAAKEIRSLIEGSQQQVQHILKSTLERVSEGKVVSEQAQTLFEKIAKDISTISSQTESINEAAREQQFGIEQIAKAMAQMDQSTQSNNSAALMAARLSDQLMSQSNKLTLIAQTVSALVLGERSDTPARDDEPSNDDQDTKPKSKTKSKVDDTHGEAFAPTVSSSDRNLDAVARISSLAQMNADDAAFVKVV